MHSSQQYALLLEAQWIDLDPHDLTCPLAAAELCDCSVHEYIHCSTQTSLTSVPSRGKVKQNTANTILPLFDL